MTQLKDDREEKQVDSCEIRLIKDEDGAVTGVEVECETPEARSAMATAINKHELVVKAKAREEDSSRAARAAEVEAINEAIRTQLGKSSGR